MRVLFIARSCADTATAESEPNKAQQRRARECAAAVAAAVGEHKASCKGGFQPARA
jgi:hypothetical protein